MNWKGYGKRQPWPNIIYHHPSIYLKELRKTTTNLSESGFRAEV
jgi:hypothetical protein